MRTKEADGTGQLRVLVVDDGAITRAVASSFLAKLDVRPTTLDNGLDAIAATIRGAYDILLMDVQMPSVDGLQAARAIRATALERQPWIVAMTAGTRTSEREACFAAGVDDYVAKPVRLEDLRAALERFRAATLGATKATA
jgi:CheY-like chemotaxis protein